MSTFSTLIINTIIQAFARHVQRVHGSDEFKEKVQDAQPFFRGVRDFIFGRSAKLENIVCLLALFFPFSNIMHSGMYERVYRALALLIGFRSTITFLPSLPITRPTRTGFPLPMISRHKHW